MEWSNYNFLLFSENYQKYFIYNSISNVRFEIEEVDFSKFSLINNHKLSVDSLDDVTKSLFLKTRILTENNKIDYLKFKLFNQIRRLDQTTLVLVIMPSDFKNEINFKNLKSYHKAEFLNKEIEEYIVNFIKKHEAKKVHITWMITCSSLISDALKRIIRQVKKMNKIIINEIISIGVNPDLEIFQALKESDGSKIHISLDFRMDIETCSSQASILNENSFKTFGVLEQIFKIFPTYITIRILFNKNEIDYGCILYKEFLKSFKEYNYNLYASFNSELFDCMLPSSDFELLLDISSKYGIKTSANFFLRKANAYCIANLINGYVIDFNGYMYKCWRESGSIDKTIGHISGQGLKENNRYLQYVINTDPFDDSRCVGCNSIMICGGGCPYSRIQGIHNCNHEIFYKRIKQCLEVQSLK